MEYAVLAPSPFADHSIIVFNLACINAVALLAAVLLTDPSGRAVVLDGHLSSTAALTNGQCSLVGTAPDDRTIPAGLLRGLRLGGSFLRERCRRQRQGKYKPKQQNE